MRRYFEDPAVARRVGSAVAARSLAPGLTDLFVTHYAEGDFLSAHNDGFSGSWAFVVSLASGPEWQPDFGGELCFQASHIAPLRARHP